MEDVGRRLGLEHHEVGRRAGGEQPLRAPEARAARVVTISSAAAVERPLNQQLAGGHSLPALAPAPASAKSVRASVPV
jgi:hypothetical protein